VDFQVLDLGLLDYSAAWDRQKAIFAQVKEGSIPDALILCRHHPVITLGRSARRQDILLPDDKLKEKGISVYQTERGGGVTYHGPGQLTAYPVFNLAHIKKDIHFYLRLLEEVALDTLSALGVYAGTSPGLTGAWVGSRKIASIGIAIKNWITFHGLSLNLKEDDLGNFSLIRPCGMDIEMTCAESLLGREIDIAQVKPIFINNLRRALCLRCICRN
jgi:lipoate-protein ligase B